MLKITIIRNNLSYIEFKDGLVKFGVFSLLDIKKQFPYFDSRRLNEWQQKGYIEKIINKWYRFTELPQSELLQYRISNCILQPSYVSLESALSYYNFIPEGVYSTIAITTKKTIKYNTSIGSFNYHVVKPAYFFGYKIVRFQQIPLLIAEPEKAIIDFLYLNSHLNSPEDFEAIRFNVQAVSEQINWSKMDTYTSIFESPTLQKKINLFKKNQLYVIPQ